MARRRGRDIEVFSLSFLDVVSCGFGAIILLLVIVKISEPAVIEKIAVDLSGLLAKLQDEKHEIRGETIVLNRDLKERQEQLSAIKTHLARLRGDLSRIQGEFHATRNDQQAQTRIEQQLRSARQTLSEEQRRLLGADYRRKPTDATIGGVPVDSEYIVFILDTSGSMHNNAWPLALQKLTEILDIHPKVKGIQVMNDMGDYLFPSYKGRWIPDTAGRRRAILKTLAGWTPFSNSSPEEGIETAIRRYAAPDKKISLYIFGDDFSRGSIQDLLDTVRNLNRSGTRGRGKVRIHAVGFPVLFANGQTTANAVRYAALMRKLAEENGGSFVGLNRYRK